MAIWQNAKGSELRVGLITVCLLLPSFLLAQDYDPKGGKYGGRKTKYRNNSGYLKKNQTDVFPLDADYRLSGWIAGLGATYMLPMRDGQDSYHAVQSRNDSTTEIFSTYSGKAKGKIGLFAEVGYFYSFTNPVLFHFAEFNLNYRQYKGGEDFSGTSKYEESDSLGNVTSGPSISQEQSSSYSDQVVSLSINLTNHKHFSRYGFIQNSLGINADYFLSPSRDAGPAFPGYEAIFPPDIQAQLHYRIGVGWKASPTILVVPAIELPVIGIYPFDGFKSSLPYYSTRQYPIIFCIRFMFLRPLSEDCNLPDYKGQSNFE